MFKIFPVTLTEDGRKIPLIKDWANAATTNQEQIALWTNMFRDRLKFWGIPTGPINNILALDVDVKSNINGFETLATLPYTPTMSQRTLNGGCHLIYQYPIDGKSYRNRTKFLPGLDIRGDGGFIVYYGTDHTPIAHPPEWLLGYALAQPQPTGESFQVDPSIAEPKIIQALDNIRNAPPGESNNVLNSEAFNLGQLIATGTITRDYAFNALMRAAIDRGKSVQEATATINSGLNGGSKKPLVEPFGKPDLFAMLAPTTERWTPTYFTTNDLNNYSALKRPQLFKDWSTKDIHITTADGGTGKTTLKLYEAVCLALGESFLGFPCVEPGKTLFITGEDTAAKLGAMIGAITRQMGIADDLTRIEIILSSIVVKKDSDLCIITKDRQGFLQPNENAFQSVMQAVEDIKPKMIIFDPISSFWGSESAVNDMAKAVIKFMSKLAIEADACVEMINHMGKVSSSSKDMTQFAGRGGTGIPSNSRVARTLRSVSDEEFLNITGESLTEKQTAMLCNIGKFTDGSPLLNNPFVIIREGFLFHRKTLESKKIREEQQRESDTERVLKFVIEQRSAGKYPTKNLITAHFMTISDRISKERTQNAIEVLCFMGDNGMKLKAVQGPDVESKERVYVLTDMEGNEI